MVAESGVSARFQGGSMLVRTRWPGVAQRKVWHERDRVG